MPTITTLDPERREGRIRLAVDGREIGTLPASFVLQRGLRTGQPLDEAELEALLRDGAGALAMEAALHCLAYRPRSRMELERHLRRKSHPPDAILHAISRCQKLGYLDDEAFARAFVRDRIRLRPRGRFRLRSELRERGIAPDVADASIEAAFEETGVSEQELLRGIAEARAFRLRQAEPASARRRLSSWLLRRGFSRSDVRRVVEDLLPESDPE
ncbi:MAG: recombination regulator RecX [marine benthic group bacterium]|nr:recombination regulator RecX [Candidatus Carthagonibacter metallireducens]